MTQPSTSGVAPSSSDEQAHENHGHSTAAWVGVGIILAASIIMSLAVVFPSMTWFVVGAVLVVVGLIAGKVLAMAGFGAKAGTYAAAHRGTEGGGDLPGRNQHNSGTQ